MKKQIIIAEKAPKAIGPYSAAVKIGNLVFTSGQLGIDPETGDLVPGGIEAETRQALQNVGSVLEASGSKFDHIIKVTVYLRDINEFGLMNSIYKEYITSDFPARSAFQVAALPKGGAIEIEAIAEIPGD
jgi:2-iminobutanoate/2-iminopropanoate deaminase